jgi:hypothetical protein
MLAMNLKLKLVGTQIKELNMTEVVTEVAEVTPPMSRSKTREAGFATLTQEELLALVIQQSRFLAEGKSLLRIAAKTFRWVNKPTDAQIIDDFLRRVKE